MERTFFEVMEDVEFIELCAVVFEPDINCPIQFSFNIHLYTANGTAGKVYCLYRDIYIYIYIYIIYIIIIIFFLLFTVEGMDYEALDVNLTFQKCIRRKCVNVTIADNQMNEANGTFTFHLNRTTELSPRIILDPVDGVFYYGDGE